MDTNNLHILNYMEKHYGKSTKCSKIACKRNNLKMIEILWSRKYIFNYKCIYLLCKYGNLHSLKYLLRQGCSMNYRCHRYAFSGRNYPINEYLVKCGYPFLLCYYGHNKPILFKPMRVNVHYSPSALIMLIIFELLIYAQIICCFLWSLGINY